jgi:aspartate carbamoyltransferase catalytic subunit
MEPRHLLGIEPLERGEIERILRRARALREVLRGPSKKRDDLRGKTVINLFFENSTRTRVSFEMAAKILGADAINWSASGSSQSKGETFLDTLRTLEAMRPDVLVVRHGASGSARLAARHLGCAVVNAGDGAHEHPTQALLDALTLEDHLGPLDGKRIAIVGDVAHSRVARSTSLCLRRLGASVVLCGPKTMLPGVAWEGVEMVHDLRAALRGADAVIALRIQTERIGESLFPSAREYSHFFGLSRRTLAWAKEGAVVLHPGPINRGVEIEPDLADGDRSLILHQVESGVAVRMAVLLRAVGKLEEESHG